MRVVSSAPARIDLAGGTIDIWPLYLLHAGAQTLNAAITLRAHCAIQSRRDDRITIVSEDTGERIEAQSAADFDLDRLPLVARLVKTFAARGLDLTTRSDSPVGAGLGGSSTMGVAVGGALAAWTGQTLDAEALLSLVMNVEGQVLGIPPGVQDFRPAFYGGVLAINLDVRGVRTDKLPVETDALTDRIVVAYTGASRNSGINNWEVFKARLDGRAEVRRAFDAICRAAGLIRQALESHDWHGVARGVADEWAARKRLAPTVTTPAIDALLERAHAAGAAAGKVCGAGGGGCLFVLGEPARKADISDALRQGGADVLSVRIEPRGLTVERS